MMASRREILEELHSTLGRAKELVQALETTSAQAISSPTDAVENVRRELEQQEEINKLKNRMQMMEDDQGELASRLVESEHHKGRLMNLYVATFQLHATLDPEDVQATIAEIAVDLLGAEVFALLLRQEDEGVCDVALSRGLDEYGANLYTDGSYRGGDPVVDATLADGVLRYGATEGSSVMAAVPLKVQDAIVGAIVLLKLFDHKPMLADDDRDLLDLLGAHAASALFAARVYATADRKLRTLESLMKLVRGA